MVSPYSGEFSTIYSEEDPSTYTRTTCLAGCACMARDQKLPVPMAGTVLHWLPAPTAKVIIDGKSSVEWKQCQDTSANVFLTDRLDLSRGYNQNSKKCQQDIATASEARRENEKEEREEKEENPLPYIAPRSDVSRCKRPESGAKVYVTLTLFVVSRHGLHATETHEAVETHSSSIIEDHRGVGPIIE